MNCATHALVEVAHDGECNDLSRGCHEGQAASMVEACIEDRCWATVVLLGGGGGFMAFLNEILGGYSTAFELVYE